MHLTRQSRNLVSSFCRENVYHHLIIEFDCGEKDKEENIKEKAKFFQKRDNNQDWLQNCLDKSKKYAGKLEKCSPLEGPLISVNNSENPLHHSVTARGVQGLLQTVILGVLASPVIRQRTFFFSRVSSNLHFFI
jgi:6-phosphofructo-2-kinase/fructose-2,6-biphosphatase